MLSKAQVLRLAASIQGWCSPEELEYIYDTALGIGPNDIYVEVGVWKGRSLAPALFAASPTTAIYAVDNFQGNMKSPTWFEGQLPNWLHDHVEMLSALAVRCGHRIDAVAIIPLDSVEAVRYVPDNLSVVRLDPDYRDDDRGTVYQNIKRDIQVWLPKIKPGGLLFGQNYGIDPQGIAQAVQELLPGFMLPNSSRGAWAWRKPQ